MARVTGNPQIKVVVELIGGLEPARSIVLQLLESGKDVVTANKALLAEHGRELFDRARALGRSIAFEAAVAGGIPIIANISQCLTANQIQSIRGILNGTSNFILSQMEESGRDYHDAVAEAQRLGYAEANPAMDVNGSDAAQKLAILAHLAFGARVRWRDIPRMGIDTVDVADLRYAGELGYSIKLLAVAELTDEGWNCTSRRRWSGAATRWPRSAGRTTPSASWATPWDGCSSTAWAPARCPPPRPSWPTSSIRSSAGRPSPSARWNCGPQRKTGVPVRRPRQAARPLLPAVQGRRPPGRAGRDRRHARAAQHLDRLGDPARTRTRMATAARCRW